MKKKIWENVWQDMEKMPLDTLGLLKKEAARKIRWARFAFDPKKSMYSVGTDPRFKKIFPKTNGYSEYKFKEVENGEFGKKIEGFRSFITGIAQYYNVPANIFIDENITKVQFQNMIRRGWEDICNQEDCMQNRGQSLGFDWGQAPDISFFYGRDKELELMNQWIKNQKSRIIVIAGMGGIGKTKLAVKYVSDYAEKSGDFDFIIWRSLVNAPEPFHILDEWIHFFSEYRQTDIPLDMNGKMKLLFHYLCRYSCLMVLDNLETVLEKSGKAGTFRQGFEAYGQILTQIGEMPHKSCLILTGRERPGVIERISGHRKHARVLNLEGIDCKQGFNIFKDAGISWASKTEITAVTDIYKGNPLALELAAKHIDSVFFGSVFDFLNSGSFVFDDIEDLLKEHFDRLSIQEQEVLFWLAINRAPVSISCLKQDIVSPVSQSKLPSTIQSLLRRLPLERTEKGFSLQPVIMDFITEIFINQICLEIREHKINLFNTHAIMKAVSEDYIRKAQKKLIAAQIIKRSCFNAPGNQEFKENLDLLLKKTKNLDQNTGGYAGGNIINLLCVLEQDLSGYDFSGMNICQAFLQGVQLHKVDFSRSEFLYSVFTQPVGTIITLAVSPDGLYLAVADTSRDIHIRDTESGHLVYTLKGHENWIRGLDFSYDNSMLASCGEDKTLRVWDMQTGLCLKVFKGHKDRVEDIAFDNTGQLLASAGYDRQVCIWDVKKGTCAAVLKGHKGPVYSCVFGPGKNMLASAGADKTIRIYNIKEKKSCARNLKAHQGGVRAIAFNQDKTIMASGGEDCSIYLWETLDFKNLDILKGHKSRIRTLAFSNNNILVSAGEDQKIMVWDIKKGECIKILYGHSNRIRSLAFGPDHTTLYTGSDDQTLRKWNLTQGECLKTFTGYTNYIRSVKFSPNGKQAAGCSQEHGADIWDLKTNQIVKTLPTKGHWALSSEFAENTWYIFTTGEDLNICIWDTDSGRVIQTLSGHENWVREILMSLDAGIISCSDDCSIKIWNRKTGQCINTLKGHLDRVSSLALSFNSLWLASGSYDWDVRIWNMKSGKCAKILKGHEGRVECLAFSPDNKFLASGSGDQAIRIWDYKTGRCIYFLKGHENWVKALAFCPESRFLASGSEDCTIRIWDMKQGKCLKILNGHNNWIMSLNFNPIDRTLASSSVDGSIKLWNITTGLCLKTLCPPRPYEGMNIQGTRGLSRSQKNMLRLLGAK
ncbi:WD40 repeat-containing protein [Desulfonema limicola]|uniref:WD40 repeat-containing protein n=1 Tax=Desulfonema limicola TaxID=45656 RepID=A0A975B7S2_9BACT|nr:NB-ARC domain-containing protein [Desulfonema limicola]QTA80243.1 WD40 repeat-containing protein [Desulfonema limicola]